MWWTSLQRDSYAAGCGGFRSASQMIRLNNTGTNTLTPIIKLGLLYFCPHRITEPNTTIDVRKLPSGVYVMRLIGERSVQVGKFVKQ